MGGEERGWEGREREGKTCKLESGVWEASGPPQERVQRTVGLRKYKSAPVAFPLEAMNHPSYSKDSNRSD